MVSQTSRIPLPCFKFFPQTIPYSSKTLLCSGFRLLLTGSCYSIDDREAAISIASGSSFAFGVSYATINIVRQNRDRRSSENASLLFTVTAVLLPIDVKLVDTSVLFLASATTF